MGPKKPAVNPIRARCRARSVDASEGVTEEDIGPGDFRDTSVSFSPAIPKMETALTLQFRCTVKLIRGDTITFRLPGFKGDAMMFTLEARPHPEGKEFHTMFHAYWAGDVNLGKGAPPTQSITLQVRRTVEANALVIVGVPESARIIVPEKLSLSKVKIEAVVKHSAGGKVPKATVMQCSEIKKRAVEEEIQEMEGIFNELQVASSLDKEELNLAYEVTPQQVDQIWEASRHVSGLKIGIAFRNELSVFKSFEEHAPLVHAFVENYKTTAKKRVQFALHKEIASNLGVHPALILVLEDAIYARMGCYYPELSRAAVMVLRLYTCEGSDIARLLGLLKGICIYRKINSAIRNVDLETFGKWSNFIAILMTCCGKFTHLPPQLMPTLYKGVKDLPAEAIQQIQSLKKDDWYMFPGFTMCVQECKYTDESFVAPDSAVLFEITNVGEGFETTDANQYPEDNEWLLPMFSSFSVSSVEVVPDRNGLIKVGLKMRASLGGVFRDDQFPEELRSLMSVIARKIKTDAVVMGDKSSLMCKIIYAHIKLGAVKHNSPQHLMYAQYLEKFADVKRASEARKVTEDGSVRWQQCTQEATVGPDGILRAAQWENFPKKTATNIETMFLKCTKNNKMHQLPDGSLLDFKEFVHDTQAKGAVPRKIRRLTGKTVSHPYSAV